MKANNPEYMQLVEETIRRNEEIQAKIEYNKIFQELNIINLMKGGNK